MTPIRNAEDMILRGSRLPLAQSIEVATLWRSGRCAEAIERVEAAVPEPVAADGAPTQ